jgi:Ca-activated chloride channel family protein
MTGTLVTIAKDVKIQIEFNPVTVHAWRLVGYENRVLAHRDFNDDRKDAGEIGAGHTVTALYEIVPAGVELREPGVDPLKYEAPESRPSPEAYSGELLNLKLRYKEPAGDTSKLIEFAVMDSTLLYSQASPDFRFASLVAAFGMLLLDSPHRGKVSYAGIAETASDCLGSDPGGRRSEFVNLVRKAQALAGQ